jgi:hypothetical protein
MQADPNQTSNLGYTPTERAWYPTNLYGAGHIYLNVPSNNESTVGDFWTPIPPPPPKRRNVLKLALVITSGVILLLGLLTVSVFASYNYGLSNGYTQGLTSGYNSGLSKGEADGYTKGHSDGYNSGHADGYNSGHTQGLLDGYQNGESTGYSNGYTAGETYIECWVIQNHPFVYGLYFNNAFAGATCQ